MGYDARLFLQPSSTAGFTCAVCARVLQDAQQCPRGHRRGAARRGAQALRCQPPPPARL
jgi:hypothetical protein